MGGPQQLWCGSQLPAGVYAPGITSRRRCMIVRRLEPLPFVALRLASRRSTRVSNRVSSRAKMVWCGHPGASSSLLLKLPDQGRPIRAAR